MIDKESRIEYNAFHFPDNGTVVQAPTLLAGYEPFILIRASESKDPDADVNIDIVTSVITMEHAVELFGILAALEVNND